MLKTGVSVAEKLATEFYKPINPEILNFQNKLNSDKLSEASFQSKFLSLMTIGIVITVIVSIFSGRR